MIVERLRGFVATGFGVGHAPLAPGTVGSVVGIGLAWLLFQGAGHVAVGVGALVVTLAGLWSSRDALRRFGRKDPPCVVVDEIAGQMLGVCLIAPTAPALLAGFLLFRLFDIAKPFPIRRAEALPGASGIMADDLLAGLLANLVQRGLHWALPGLWGAA